MKITVGTPSQYQDIDQGKTLLNIPWTLTDDSGALLQEGNQSFALEATQDDIKTFLAQKLQVYKDNVARHAEAQTLQAGIDNAQTVADTITGFSITD